MEKQEPDNFRMILNFKHLNKYVDKYFHPIGNI